MWLCTKDLFPEFWSSQVEIYTAGGSASTLLFGITLAHAENIKQLVMGKIQKEL
jgi:protease II